MKTIFGNHHEPDQIVDIRQRGPLEMIHRNRAVDAPFQKVGACRLYVARVGIQSVNQETVIRAQGGGHVAVSTTQVDDQAALYISRGQEAHPGVVPAGADDSGKSASSSADASSAGDV